MTGPKTKTPRTRSRPPEKKVTVVGAGETVEAPAPEPETPARYGTLSRGRVYYYKDHRFEQGISAPVTEAVEDYLTEHAVDMVTVEGENENQYRQKFIFSDEPFDPSAPPKKRGRR